MGVGGCAVNNCRLEVSQSKHIYKRMMKACSGADSVTANERQSSWCLLLVFDVLVAEEVEQSDLEWKTGFDDRCHCRVHSSPHLFHINSFLEEDPAGDDVENEAKRVREDDLRSERPVEPADIARVPVELVDAGGDELVVGLLLKLNLK